MWQTDKVRQQNITVLLQPTTVTANLQIVILNYSIFAIL